MAKILTTKGVAAELEDIIRTSVDEVYLISYSFRISKSFIHRIEQAVDDGVKINIVYGKFVYDNTLDSLLHIKNLSVHYCQNLHAKIYCNSEKCILGSMNFSEQSEMQNIELGVLLTRQEDEAAFLDAVKHCRQIYKAAASHPHKNSAKNGQLNRTGYCIRTGVPIPLDHERPFCAASYFEWAKTRDAGIRENYDHFSGEQTNGFTSMRYPILNRNWDKYLRALNNENVNASPILPF